MGGDRWWSEGVVYHVYPRSFQDSNGDGVGDLRGLIQRLDHIIELGADAVWLSPVNPSPMADFGYDISDYNGIDPVFGTDADFDELVDAAHERGLRVVMDLVATHTSIEHPWFREHPDRYIWADGSGVDGPPNQWRSIFGGPAWTRHASTGRWYMHSFYPQQPDLNWHNEDVRRAFREVIRFWRGRGVDGFRLDSLETLVQDAQLRDDPITEVPFGLPLRYPDAGKDFVHSRDAEGTHLALAALRDAAGDAFLVGEVYLPASRLGPYLEVLDCAFAFELFHAAVEPDALRAAIESSILASRGTDAVPGWVASNHDFPRLANRVGRANERVLAMLLLTLPGCVFLYQGDEIGLADGDRSKPPLDRADRDRHRHPMQWDSSRTAGFTAGEPWLAPVDPAARNVADQRGAPDSLFSLYRALLALRRTLHGPVRFLRAPAGALAFARGEHRVVLNLSDTSVRVTCGGKPEIATQAFAWDGSLPPRSGIILRTDYNRLRGGVLGAAQTASERGSE
jgi:alpha-glucosidase